jgi:hypothetical protein
MNRYVLCVIFYFWSLLVYAADPGYWVPFQEPVTPTPSSRPRKEEVSKEKFQELYTTIQNNPDFLKLVCNSSKSARFMEKLKIFLNTQSPDLHKYDIDNFAERLWRQFHDQKILDYRVQLFAPLKRVVEQDPEFQFPPTRGEVLREFEQELWQDWSAKVDLRDEAQVAKLQAAIIQALGLKKDELDKDRSSRKQRTKKHFYESIRACIKKVYETPAQPKYTPGEEFLVDETVLTPQQRTSPENIKARQKFQTLDNFYTLRNLLHEGHKVLSREAFNTVLANVTGDLANFFVQDVYPRKNSPDLVLELHEQVEKQRKPYREILDDLRSLRRRSRREEERERNILREHFKNPRRAAEQARIAKEV